MTMNNNQEKRWSAQGYRQTRRSENRQIRIPKPGVAVSNPAGGTARPTSARLFELCSIKASMPAQEVEASTCDSNVLRCPTLWHKEIGRPARSRAATFHFVFAPISTNASPLERTA